MTKLLIRLFVKDYKNVGDTQVRKKYGFFSSIVGICVNILLSCIKLVLGLITASVAIMADGLNNLSDAGSSVISLVSFKMAAKPADRIYPSLKYKPGLTEVILILTVTKSYVALIALFPNVQ